MRRQRLCDGVIRFALKHDVNLGSPPCQFDAGNRRVRAFVHHIIDFATKGIECRNRLTPLGRQKQKGVVKA